MAERTQPQGGRTADPRMNRLLAALEPADYDALMAEAKVVAFKLEKRLYRQDDPVDTVYFRQQPT